MNSPHPNKKISLWVQKYRLSQLSDMSKKIGTSVSELIRIAVKELIEKDVNASFSMTRKDGDKDANTKTKK